MAESHKHDITQADFKLFVVLWNQKMAQATPQVHLCMAGWLEHCWISGKRNMLLQAFRSSGKSTIAGLFAAWLLYRNPDLRILVLAADYNLACKMVRNVRRVIEYHPLTQKLKPKKAEQWASDRFTVKRNTVLRDPSMAAHGVMSNITGSRADIIICDDVEVPDTSDTPDKRMNLRERLAEIGYVLGDGKGGQLYIGTPHTYYTIYADAPRREIGEEREFLAGFERLMLPLLDQHSECAWPERYGDEDIKRMKAESGPAKFTSQMLLKPTNIVQSRLDPARLNVYAHELDYTKELQSLFIGPKKMISASAWWDPSFGSGTGDRSVLAVVFADEAGNFYLHHLSYIKTSRNDETDEATQQCRKVAALAHEMLLPSVTVEGNGIGKFLPRMLRNEMTRAHALCGVKEFNNTRPKTLRILEAFDALLAAKKLYVHKSVLKTPFMMEMQEWQPFSNSCHDDGLDAVAGALSQQPVRLKTLDRIPGAHDWMPGAKGQKARAEFEV